MAYRSDLDAAHARVAALERELAAAKQELRTRLRCDRCSAGLASEHLDRANGKVTCRECRRVVDAGKPPPPRGLEIEDTPERLRISWAWKLSWGDVAAFFLILVIVIAALMKAPERPAAITAAVLLFGGFALFLAWGILAQLSNHTTVEVSGGRLTIASGPISIAGRTTLDGNAIDQLFCTLVPSKYSAWYALHVRLKNGRQRCLIAEIGDAERAFYLERELERRLGIADRPASANPGSSSAR